MTPPNLHESFDARVWAKAFVETVTSHPEIPTDEGTMIAWFANALMRGYDEHARASEARVASLTAALNGMLNMYVSLVNSGDAGFWDPETIPEVIAARASLTGAEP